MIWGVLMRSLHIAPLQAAMVFALGILIGGGALTGFAPRMQPVGDPVITGGAKSECTSGDAVADFVCRNTWLANTRHSYR
jgi:hypothetical protein